MFKVWKASSTQVGRNLIRNMTGIGRVASGVGETLTITA